jgi:hypothetical protein
MNFEYARIGLDDNGFPLLPEKSVSVMMVDTKAVTTTGKGSRSSSPRRHHHSGRSAPLPAEEKPTDTE